MGEGAEPIRVLVRRPSREAELGVVSRWPAVLRDPSARSRKPAAAAGVPSAGEEPEASSGAILENT